MFDSWKVSILSSGIGVRSELAFFVTDFVYVRLQLYTRLGIIVDM